MRADLHAHSGVSDGTDTPAEFVAAAAAAGLTVVALTDHDTAAGVPAAAAELPSGLGLLAGMELSCRFTAVDGVRVGVHLLAYGTDPANPALRASCTRLRDGRLSRTRRMVALLAADGLPVSWEQVARIAGGGSVGRPHVARALVEAGVLTSVQAAFTEEWIGAGGRYYVDKVEADVTEAIELVRAAGGVSVLAHPLASQRGRTLSDDEIVCLAGAGLTGLEIDHPEHDRDRRDHLHRIAAAAGLLVTGGSDYHGGNKPNRLGAELTAPGVVEDLLARCTGPALLGGPA